MNTRYTATAGNLPEQLHTERLLLRPYQSGDEQDFFRLVSENRERLEESFPTRAAMTRLLDDALAQVAQLSTDWGARRSFSFGIWLRENKRYIGEVMLKNFEHKIPKAETAFYLDATAEGKGYAAEALTAVVKFAFDELHLKKLYLRCVPENKRSCALAERCGFVKEGLLRHDILINRSAKLADVYYFGLTRSDYDQQHLSATGHEALSVTVK